MTTINPQNKHRRLKTSGLTCCINIRLILNKIPRTFVLCKKNPSPIFCSAPHEIFPHQHCREIRLNPQAARGFFSTGRPSSVKRTPARRALFSLANRVIRPTPPRSSPSRRAQGSAQGWRRENQDGNPNPPKWVPVSNQPQGGQFRNRVRPPKQAGCMAYIPVSVPPGNPSFWFVSQLQRRHIP